MDLSALLSRRTFWRRTDPFPHVIAKDVFAAAFAGELEASFRAVLGRGRSPVRDLERFSRSVPGYGAYVYNLGPETEGPLSVFLSRPFHDMLACLFGVRATLDVDAALHHHDRQSPSGWIHNDLNPGWFVDQPRPDGVNASDARVCDYQKGISSVGAPRETVRAVAMMYYLANDPWAPGDGGETGLYSSQRDPVERPLLRVPPLNNTLVAFACSPNSYHAFLENRRSARSSVVVWLHRPKAEVVERWGERSIQRWPNT